MNHVWLNSVGWKHMREIFIYTKLWICSYQNLQFLKEMANDKNHINSQVENSAQGFYGSPSLFQYYKTEPSPTLSYIKIVNSFIK